MWYQKFEWTVTLEMEMSNQMSIFKTLRKWLMARVENVVEATLINSNWVIHLNLSQPVILENTYNIFIKLLTGRVEKVVNLIQFNSNCRFGNLHWGMVKNVVKSTWFNSNQMIWLLYSKPVILRVYMQGTYKIYHNLLWIDLTKDESSWIESDWMKVYL